MDILHMTTKQLVEKLKQILPEKNVSTNENLRQLHGTDESYHKESLPDVVIFPENRNQVSEIMKIANKNHVPVVPFGLGTSLEGHVIPYHNGISIDFSLMNKIIEIKEDDFLVRVEPGVTRTQLNKELKKYGLFFSVDPGADATLGGMAATNASGTTAVKYGVMRDQVRNLEVVLADGTIIETGNQAAKSASGLHLNGLFTGSEGILGCFTELTLKVHGIPEHVLAARASFPSINDATEAVVSILQAGIPVARIELVDEASIRQVNIHSETNYYVGPTLFMEFHGNEAGLNEDVEFMKAIVQEHQCQEIIFEKDNHERQKLWEARHNLAYAFIHGYPGRKSMGTDVCVPISELANAIMYARENLDITGLPGGIVGHVGDGNFHVLLMIDMDNEEELKKANRFNEQLVMYALKRGGTCTGEHGVGIGKLKYQEKEHGESYKVMQQIKKVLDPNNILNKGKLIKIDEEEIIISEKSHSLDNKI